MDQYFSKESNLRHLEIQTTTWQYPSEDIELNLSFLAKAKDLETFSLQSNPMPTNLMDFLPEIVTSPNLNTISLLFSITTPDLFLQLLQNLVNVIPRETKLKNLNISIRVILS